MAGVEGTTFIRKINPEDTAWAIEQLREGRRTEDVAKDIGITASSLSTHLLMRTGTSTREYREDAKIKKPHQMPKNCHPCGVRKSDWKICRTQCHLADHCEAAQAVGVKKDATGTRIIPDVIQHRLVKREAWY